ncbi:DNA primase [Capnocytophaga canimorsus]|uniref:DNA primase n=1 Tax=Capnocytophaga canimorsus TaxID=28188 RepID=A0A0B7HC98_9FLAO|nr:DNA primase [Capnocytophaga canimorsus]ATA77111.1 DNA primase [Capnocytophaga canimorsus]PJI83747.1 DNA primase [Capnocytophaga canimorsus]CEN37326.1 DNA primase [Capnocytophaga canimorsus]STA72327.1 DNA primase [Capnocytophaga canimorsus]
MISKSTIDKIFDAMRVEEVIGDFVQLKKAGANYKGLSPFSNERTPSFMVSPVKQIWKDFSSGKGGNAVAFLMEHEHFTYPEALRYLAKKYHIEIEETQIDDDEKVKADHRESLYIVSQYAQQFFEENLWQTQEGKAIGLSYFKERGFTEETIKKFHLGYSPDLWEAFTQEALKQGYQLEFLEETGLTIVKDDKKFDRFKGRVMFPIHSMSGRVLGFGGRILTQDKKAAKYLNSPESEIYHKSKILYGIYHAKQAIAKANNCYLVEGYTDVIQFHQRGIENVVASSGTALTPEQIRLINRLTPNITLLYDGDAAGLRASLRGVDLILEQGMNVKICTFPEGEDPDSFARKHAFEDLVLYLEENATDFIRFKASLLVQEAKNDPIKKSETIRDMVESISKISDMIKQEVYLRECAVLMDISEDVLFSTLSQISKKDIYENQRKERKTQKPMELVRTKEEQLKTQINRLESLEYELVKHLLLYGKEEGISTEKILVADENNQLKEQEVQRKLKVHEKIFLELQQDEIELSTPDFQQIYSEIIAKYHQNPDFEQSTLANELPMELSPKVSEILMSEEKEQLCDWEKRGIVVKSKSETAFFAVDDILLNIRLFLVNKIIFDFQNQIAETVSEDEKRDILENIINYMQLRKVLFHRLSRVV